MTTKPRANRQDAARAVNNIHDLDLHTYIQQLLDDQRSYRYIANTIGELTGGPTPSTQTIINWAKNQ